MVANQKKRWTVEEYLAFERTSPERHEFLAGEIFLMSGASRQHNLIGTNTVASLHPQLRGKPCELYANDMRVKVSPTGLYTYPDVVMACGEPQFEDSEVDTLLNPTVIIEILSHSTKEYDRVGKFAHYRKLASFKEYLLIDQDGHQVDHYVRNSDNTWLLSVTNQVGATIELPSVGCTLLVADLYEKVMFEGDET
jgi:Uma2 family endonuclease